MLKECLWGQFGASIDMLENAISLCPMKYWDTEKKFWYHAYHCLFFLDYYLTMEPADFSPPPPFSKSEFGEGMPERVYTPNELLILLQLCRRKCQRLMAGLDEEKLNSRWINVTGKMNYSVLEILLYNMRHVQHHTGQLNLILRQEINQAPQWIRSHGKLARGGGYPRFSK